MTVTTAAPPTFHVSETESAQRKAFLELGPDDHALLREAAPHVAQALPALVEKTFTQDVMRYADPASLLHRVVAEGRLAPVAQKLVQAFQQYFESEVDAAYTARRVQIGQVHARIGLEPRWYLAALNLMQRRLSEVIAAAPPYAKDPAKALAVLRSLSKIMTYDSMVVLDAYLEHSLGRTIRSQEEALRELSSPVVEVWEEILVIPLIGTMDTRRAQEVTESILDGVVEKHARVVIIDITGLPVMDTSTANHLFKTVRAIELLGSQAVITGVRPAIAQTVVSLGVDTATLKTRARLVDGLRLALELTGRRVGDASLPRPAPPAAAPRFEAVP